MNAEPGMPGWLAALGCVNSRPGYAKRYVVGFPMVTIPEHDAKAIEHTAQYVHLNRSGTIRDGELIDDLFDTLHIVETDCAVAQCVAQIPPSLHPLIATKLTSVMALDHPGSIFVYSPMVPTSTELADLDTKVAHIISVVSGYLDHPTGQTSFNVKPFDRALKFWQDLQQFPSVKNSPCKTNLCLADRMVRSIYCHRHHFEMIHGEAPPVTT